MMTKALTLAALIASAFSIPTVAQAAEGNFMVRLRALSMINDNDNSNGPVRNIANLGDVEADDKIFPEIDFTYFFTKNLAAELILTYPQKHDITVGGINIGTLKHLPPTLTLQYHFNPEGDFRPYAGAGLNYTKFMSVRTSAGNLAGGALGNPAVRVESGSFGLAAQLGFDFKVAPQWFVNFDVKKVFIETEVSVDGLGKYVDLDIDPWLVSVGVGYRF
jgi:outer membrane protein